MRTRRELLTAVLVAPIAAAMPAVEPNTFIASIDFCPPITNIQGSGERWTKESYALAVKEWREGLERAVNQRSYVSLWADSGYFDGKEMTGEL